VDTRALRLTPRRGGFTVIEIALVLGVIGILSGIAVARFTGYRERARTAQVISDMRSIEDEVRSTKLQTGRLPRDLVEAGFGTLLDPWGNPYQYTVLATVPRGKWRKDRFLVPINSEFDLWSMGPDGWSAPPLTAKSSRDDIIRANDGSFYGLASEY
jgi:general secretion pathway protein G